MIFLFCLSFDSICNFFPELMDWNRFFFKYLCF